MFAAPNVGFEHCVLKRHVLYAAYQFIVKKAAARFYGLRVYARTKHKVEKDIFAHALCPNVAFIYEKRMLRFAF